MPTPGAAGPVAEPPNGRLDGVAGVAGGTKQERAPRYVSDFDLRALLAPAPPPPPPPPPLPPPSPPLPAAPGAQTPHPLPAALRGTTRSSSFEGGHEPEHAPLPLPLPADLRGTTRSSPPSPRSLRVRCHCSSPLATHREPHRRGSAASTRCSRRRGCGQAPRTVGTAAWRARRRVRSRSAPSTR